MTPIVRLAVCVASVFSASATMAASPAGPSAGANRAPLAATPFVRLPIGSVRAEGWLLNQLQLQKAGLTGSAEQIYEALTPDSAWLGGKGEAWEKGPYYVRGLVALAYTLDDAELKQRAQKWVDWTLQSQRPDGFFGPTSNDDWWPRMVALYFLKDHYEATGDPRVVPFLLKYFRHQLMALPNRPLIDWGKSRAGDNIDVVLWTYNQTGEPFLLDLAKTLYTQAYPWQSIFTDNRFYGFGEDFQPHHIVNVSQALKFPAVAWQFTHNDADRAAYAAGVANLDRQYGRIDGQVSGTEMLSGRASTDGVELCADIERIISDGIAVTALGDAAIGDRLEKVAYNSMPAHTSPRMHQITYYQLPNQVAATDGGHGFTQDYANGNVPGPHSGFPCCCYNWHAGWPKFVQQMWAGTSDGGLALIAYGPNRVTTTVNGNVPITVTEATDYPFGDRVTLKVNPKSPATFPLVVRIPGWCDAAVVTVNGQAVPATAAGQFVHVAREWKAGDVVELTFPMTVRTSTWVNQSVGFERGPLAFALKIKEDWKKKTEFLRDFDEFEVLPQSPWNYALQVAPQAADVKVVTRPVSAIPFATDAAPVTLSLPARRLPEWGYRTLPGTVTIGRADGAWHPIRDGRTPLVAGKPNHLRVEAKGASLKVFVNDMDAPVLDVTDATFASGRIGLRTYRTAARFDDIKIDGNAVADFNNPSSAAAWQTFGGQWAVRNGVFTARPADGAKAVLKDGTELKDFTLDATVTVDAGSDAGVIFRVTEPTTAADGYHGYYVGLSAHKQSEDAQEPPVSPVVSSEKTETVELIPFASAKLRVSYFPVLKAE